MNIVVPNAVYPWRFRSVHAMHGPNRLVPIQVTAIRQQTDSSIDQVYATLVRDMQIAIKTYIEIYANRIGCTVSQHGMNNMKIFLCPISRVNNGREMRRPSGSVRVGEINYDVLDEILDQVQSEEEGIYLT